MSKISLKHSGGNVVSLNSPTSAPTSSDVAFKLPNADGSAGQFMKTDGSGNLSFDAAGGGKFLQVVQSIDHTRFQTSSTTFVASPHAVTITPTAASSKIMVNFIGLVNTDGSNQRIFVDIYRSVAGGTATGLAPQGTNTTTGAGDSAGFMGSIRADSSRLQAPMNLQYLDTPTYSLGNAIVYTLYTRSGGSYNVEVPGANEQEPFIRMATEIGA